LSFITELFNHYGYIVLYISLTLELIAFPTPGEALMTYCGFMVFQGKLDWVISIAVASAGVITGITISYFLGGILGKKFFAKYGAYVHMGSEKLEKTSIWFNKYGNGLLVVAYFIPGVRHITGYFAGITKIPYKRFAINAYLGAFIWTGTFISIGKILGANWEKFHVAIKKYLIIGGIVVGVILLCIYLYRSYKHQIVEFIMNSLKNSFAIFQSLGKIRIAMMATVVAFLVLSILVVGLIQDFFANEFSKFDTITNYLVGKIFSQNWSVIMKYFSFLTFYPILILITTLLVLWIRVKGKNRFLEFRFLLITVLGGEVLEELLRFVFHRIGLLGANIIGHSRYTFPSEQSLMAIVTYGFAAFIILRHVKRTWIRTAITTIVLIICFFAGLSPLFYQLQHPSDILAGYVFGGVWLSLNIIRLELLRILPNIEKNI